MDAPFWQLVLAGGVAVVTALVILGFRAGRRREQRRARALISAAQRLVRGEPLGRPDGPAWEDPDWAELENAADEGRRRREEGLLAASQRRREGHDEAFQALAHDLSGRLAEALAPLPALLSRIEKSAAASPESQRAVEDLRRSLEPAQRLLGQLRAIGPPKPETRSRQGLEGLAGLAVAATEGRALASGVTLEFAPPDRSLPVLVEAPALLGALEALIDNAVHAAAPARGRVWVWAESGPATSAVIVEDDGPGIPPALHAAIFDPLFSTRPETGGTGLGLPLALAVARRHGGDLVLGSRPGGGTVARLTLPAAPSPGTP